MKKILLFPYIFVSSFVFAQENKIHVLTIQLTDGIEEAFILSKKPIVSMPNYKFQIDGTIEATYNRNEVAKFYFEYLSPDDPKIKAGVGIESVEKNHVKFSYTDGKNVRISGLKGGTLVFVHTLDGKNISTQKSEGNEVVVSLGNLPKGVYVISYGNRSVKITR